MSRILIVGAGIAGSLAAHDLLAAGHEVIVLDKGFAPGGRVATRTVGDAVFDHGAQFLTAKSARFRALIADWNAAGITRTWFHGSPDLPSTDGGSRTTQQSTATQTQESDGHPRYHGSPTMRRIGEHLSEGLDVRLGTVVAAAEPTPHGWCLHGSLRDGLTAESLEADALLLTAPVPQTLALLDAGGASLTPEHRHALDEVRFDPCISVLARPHGPTTLPARGGARLTEGPIAFLTDNRVTGASPVPAITIHASAEHSRDRFGGTDAQIGRELVALARPHLGTDADVLHVHRWRYATPTSRTDHDSILDRSHGAPLAIAGDGLAGGRIEGAARSGWDAARRLTEALAVPA